MKIINYVGFPLQKCHGNIQQREKIALKYVNKLFKRIYCEEPRAITIDKIQDKAYRFKDAFIKVEDYQPANGIEGIKQLLRFNSTIAGVIINIPVSKFENPRSLSLCSTMMHEFAHAFFSYSNPKTVVRSAQHCDKISTSIYDEIVNKNILETEYSNPKNYIDSLKSILEKNIKYRHSNTKINLFQMLRYTIMDEKFAYNTGEKFKHKLRALDKIAKPKITEDMNIEQKSDFIFQHVKVDYNRFFLFDEKIEMINKLLATELKKVRAAHAKKIAQNNSVL